MYAPRARVPTMLLILAGLFALWSGLTSTMVFGAPSKLDCRYVMFTAPSAGATLSGATEIRGRAQILDFRFYKVEYSPVGRETWVLIGTDVIRAPVENGRLVVWQTTKVPDGPYQLRLHVVDPTGNYCESLLSPVRVSNVRPTEVLVPTPTETSILTVVPPQATPTFVVPVPTEVAPIRNTPGALPTRSLPLGLSAPDPLVTGAFFFLGVCGMIWIIGLVAAVMFVRHLSS